MVESGVELAVSDKAISTLDSELKQLRRRVREVLRQVSASNTSENKWEHDVFISYRQNESWEAAKTLYEFLRRGKHPINMKSLRVFWDEVSLKAGQNLDVRLQNALLSSACFIVLLTPEYAKTEYTLFEQKLITGADWGSIEERIIPVVVQECEVPERLKHIIRKDLTGVLPSSSARPNDAVDQIVSVLGRIKRSSRRWTTFSGHMLEVMWRDDNCIDTLVHGKLLSEGDRTILTTWGWNVSGEHIYERTWRVTSEDDLNAVAKELAQVHAEVLKRHSHDLF